MSEEKVDYLEIDKPIPGQNYVCISFLSPDNVIKQKELFLFNKFMNQRCGELETRLEEIIKDSPEGIKKKIQNQITNELRELLKSDYNQFKDKYDDFKYKFNDDLNNAFDKISNKQTSIRGVKVRGCYDSYTEAERRAKELQRSDRSFHVFVGQVGYWLPWDPIADHVQNEEYLEEELNTLMSEYKKNEINRDIFYEEQKREKQQDALKERMKAEKEKQKKIESDIQEPDPWMQSTFKTEESNESKTVTSSWREAEAEEAAAEEAAEEAEATVNETTQSNEVKTI